MHCIASIVCRTAALLLPSLPVFASTQDFADTIEPGRTIDPTRTKDPSRTIEPDRTIDPSHTLDPGRTIYRPEPAYMQPFGTSARVLTCESRGHGYKRCASPSRHVRMQQQLSAAACQEGRDWGVEHGAIWVNNGCRATFIAE